MYRGGAAGVEYGIDYAKKQRRRGGGDKYEIEETEKTTNGKELQSREELPLMTAEKNDISALYLPPDFLIWWGWVGVADERQIGGCVSLVVRCGRVSCSGDATISVWNGRIDEADGTRLRGGGFGDRQIWQEQQKGLTEKQCELELETRPAVTNTKSSISASLVDAMFGNLSESIKELGCRLEYCCS